MNHIGPLNLSPELLANGFALSYDDKILTAIRYPLELYIYVSAGELIVINNPTNEKWTYINFCIFFTITTFIKINHNEKSK